MTPIPGRAPRPVRTIGWAQRKRFDGLDPTRLQDSGTSLGAPTLLFTDIEGSTRLLDRLGDRRYAELLALHQRVIRDALRLHGGTEQNTEGDSFFATFAEARDGVAAASAAQQALTATEWPDDAQVRVRMGLHAGPVALAGGNLVGMAIHAAARIGAAAHGGQVVVSSAVARQLGPIDDVALRHLGSHRLHPSIEPRLLAALMELLGDDLQTRPRNGRLRLGDRWVVNQS